MYYRNTTQIPNELFDQHLRHLNQSQIKVILVVLRQTLGWIDPKTNQRKRKDWISMTFFVRRTGLTRKSVSIAIEELIQKELLIALDYYEDELRLPKDRRGKKKIYYAYAPYFRTLKARTWVENLADMFTYRYKTKPNPTKNKFHQTHFSNQKQTDFQRYQQLQQQRRDRPNTP